MGKPYLVVPGRGIYILGNIVSNFPRVQAKKRNIVIYGSSFNRADGSMNLVSSVKEVQDMRFLYESSIIFKEYFENNCRNFLC